MNLFKVGLKGENEACKYLKQNKYKILERNYRKTYGEIDIIAKKEDFICFIEVKTRKSTDFGLPCEFVNISKQKRIIKTAKSYISEKNINSYFRFDIIEVYTDNCKVAKIEHLEGAFTL